MSDSNPLIAMADVLEKAVNALQIVIAFFLVVVLVVGVVNLIATFARAALAVELLGYKDAVGLISTTVDIVLYLFIVIELFRTIVAYVEARNVVKAVIHAGLIAVVRQIIIFKPGDVGTPSEALMSAGVFVLLLLGLLLGFFLVHREEEIE